MELVKNPIDFDRVEIRKYPVQALKRNINKRVVGLDTETLDGGCRLIADSHGRYLLDGDVHDLLDFLTYKGYRVAHNFYFNLNFDVNAIIKFLPRENLEQLRETKRTKFEGHSLFYIPKKILRITKSKHVYKYYDVMQFFNTSLEKASLRYLGLDKYVEPIDRARLGTDAQYWEDNIDAIIKYCINDAKLTARLGMLLDDTLTKNIGVHPSSYISKASVTKDFVRKSVDLPDILQIPRNALKYAFNSYSGGRFEVIKKGYVGNCTLYDINSAYPHTIRDLLDVTQGEWKWVTDFHEEADYGFYLVEVTTKYDKISPVPVHLPNGIICYPMINCLTYMTKEELLAFDDCLEWEIISGWEFYAERLVYPFREYIDKVYALKNQCDETSYDYSMYKILMNSLYGCFYEKVLRGNTIWSGKLFNPIYATLITALSRIELFKVAMPYKEDIVGFATDSILFQGNPDIPCSRDLGDWSLHAEGETIVLRSGIYQIADIMKNRGIKKAESIKTPYGDYDNIFDYIKSQPKNIEYPIIMNRPLTFIEVLQHHKAHDLVDINVFTDLEYKININRDYKRLWNEQFEGGEEVFTKAIDSEPLLLYA